jgi:hypothetical protein
MDVDRNAIVNNIRAAPTEDLLNRATVYRDGMEPEALRLIEEELRRRGVGEDGVRAHAEEQDAQVLRAPEGWALRCSFCDRPAVTRGWGWHRMWGVLAVFPRPFRYCREHADPAYREDPPAPADDFDDAATN